MLKHLVKQKGIPLLTTLTSLGLPSVIKLLSLVLSTVCPLYTPCGKCRQNGHAAYRILNYGDVVKKFVYLGPVVNNKKDISLKFNHRIILANS